MIAVLFLSVITLIIILGVSLASAMEAVAQVQKADSMMIEPGPYYGNSNQPIQNSQFYSVVFDEEGEAVVALKLNILNPNNETVDKIKIEIPGQTIRILNVVQEYHLLKEQCAQWKDVCADEKCTSYYKKCAYYHSYVDNYEARYYPVEYTAEKLSDSTAYTFNLPKVITQQNTATLIIYYKATGYVKKSLGVFDFNFETIKYNYDASHVRVSINVQNELYLAGGTSNVDYKPADFGGLAMSKSTESFDSKQLSEYSRSIEYDYGYVKEASALDPWESFHVKGRYSASRLLLNKGKIGLTIGIILAVIGLLIFGIRKAYGALKTSTLANANSNTSSAKAKKETSNEFAAQQPLTHQALVTILIASFISSILLLAGWFALTYVSLNLYNWVGYGYSGSLSLLLVLVFFLFSLFVLLAPAIYVGARLGILSGFATFGAIIGFLIIELIILAVIFASLNMPRMYY